MWETPILEEVDRFRVGHEEAFSVILVQFNFSCFSLREARMMADSDLQEAVLDALSHYNDLEAPQVSPLGKLDGLWPLPPSATKELLASQARGREFESRMC